MKIIKIGVFVVLIIVVFVNRDFLINFSKTVYKNQNTTPPPKECLDFGEPILITPVLVMDDKFRMPHHDFVLKECQSAKIVGTGIDIEYRGQATVPGWEGGMGASVKITEDSKPYNWNESKYAIWPSGYDKNVGATFTISENGIEYDFSR